MSPKTSQRKTTHHITLLQVCCASGIPEGCLKVNAQTSTLHAPALDGEADRLDAIPPGFSPLQCVFLQVFVRDVEITRLQITLVVF